MELNGQWEDWIESFLSFTEGINSPEIFRLWAAIGGVAGALERRVHIFTGRSGNIYPNMYIILAAPPGVGKTQAIGQVEKLWYDCKKFKVAPHSVTKAALIDTLDAADRKLLVPNGIMIYHSLLVPSSEFGVLVPSNDLEFMSTLNYVYDNPPALREKRRFMGKEEIDISLPQLNILGGTQPSYLATILPEEAWSMGFTSRFTMIYCSSSPLTELFLEDKYNKDQYDLLVRRMIQMSNLFGEFKLEPEAKIRLRELHREGIQPSPLHSKLLSYSARRTVSLLKLTMISAVSRTGEIIGTVNDVERARIWMLDAERVMPDIFREMAGKSDAQVIENLYNYLWALWVGQGTANKLVHESKLWSYLGSQVTSGREVKIIETCLRSHVIAKEARGSEWYYRPRPRHEHGGVE